MKVLVFGGTFNPVHNGHVKLCKFLSKQLAVDKVIIIPTYLPVHKTVSGDFASVQDRMNMCKIAFSQIDNCEISDIETSQNKACYSVDTLTKLHDAYPNSDVYFACGSDMFLSLDQWKDPDKLFTLATFCAVPRKDEFNLMHEKAKQWQKSGLKCQIFDTDYIKISSTEIRNSIKNGNFDIQVDKRVIDYIKQNKLYGA